MKSLPNMSHQHWRKLKRVVDKQKKATKRALKDKVIPPLPLLVIMTRVGPRKLDDDNLQGSLKYIRDEIARAVGVDDGSPLYTWLYMDRKGEYGVEVEIIER